jgi:hypothetical protein
MTLPDEVQFTAIQTWSDGSARDVTAGAQWTSIKPAVLAVNAGVAKGLAVGEAGLTARLEQLTSQLKFVRVVPAGPEWDGTYTLTVGGGACNATSIPLSPELRQRTYTALIRQSGLSLSGTISKVAVFVGQIIHPDVRFYLSGTTTFARPVNRASGFIRPVSFAAYPGSSTPPGLADLLADGVLVISGDASTTMSPAGFTGTLNGTFALYRLIRTIPGGFLLFDNIPLAVCASSSHGFTLLRN